MKTDARAIILAELQRGPGTIREMVKRTSLSRPTVARWLEHLRECREAHIGALLVKGKGNTTENVYTAGRGANVARNRHSIELPEHDLKWLHAMGGAAFIAGLRKNYLMTSKKVNKALQSGATHREVAVKLKMSTKTIQRFKRDPLMALFGGMPLESANAPESRNQHSKPSPAVCRSEA